MAYYRYMYPIIAYFFYSFNRWENEKFKKLFAVKINGFKALKSLSFEVHLIVFSAFCVQKLDFHFLAIQDKIFITEKMNQSFSTPH